MRRLLVPAVLVGLLAGGCGGGGGGGASSNSAPTTTAAGPTTTLPVRTTSLRAYFLKDDKVQPVLRDVPTTRAVAGAALNQLGLGPTKAEAKLGLTSKVPAGGIDIALSNGVIAVKGPTLSRPALAQVVYTLTQFPTVKAVELGGKRYTRADFEDETPPILVESPLPFANVTSPLRATGTANTFEATFNYDLVDTHGTVIGTHFVTATSGSGTRGTFDFSVPFTVDRSGQGELIVYERSAENGQRIHVNEIPVYLEQ
jgi:Immunoglobulin-like domain of bacterial spore germination/Sporulation and spore germination